MGNCADKCCAGPEKEVPRKRTAPMIPEGPFDPKTDVLHVITTVFDPSGKGSRAELYRRFAAEMEKQPNVILYTVECLFPGEAEFQVTKENHPWHLQVRAPHRIWVRENLVNQAVRRLLPDSWEHMAWVDCDVLFHGGNLAERTIRALGVNPMVQMWEQANFLGPKGEVLEQNRSFGYYCKRKEAINSVDPTESSGTSTKRTHPGLAWATTRDAFDMVDGLPDFAITGSADSHIAYALIGRVKESVPDAAFESPGYNNSLHQLENRLMGMQRSQRSRSVDPGRAMGPGYARGVTVSHMWNGECRDREHTEKLMKCMVVEGAAFDPYKDLQKGRNGVVMLADVQYLQPVEEYFASRRADFKEAGSAPPATATATVPDVRLFQAEHNRQSRSNEEQQQQQNGTKNRTGGAGYGQAQRPRGYGNSSTKRG